MNPDPAPDPSQTRETSAAEVVELLDVWLGVEADRRRKPHVVLSLGDANGGVRQVCLPQAQGWTLFQKLGDHFRVGAELGTAPPHSPKYLRPHSILRSKLAFKVLRADAMLAGLREAVPALAEFVEEELAALSASIHRNCGTRRTAKRIVDRLERAVLVAVDTMRLDT